MMNKKLAALLLCLMTVLTASAQSVKIQWTLGDVNNLSNVTLTGDENYTKLFTTSYAQGAKIARVTALGNSGADAGFTAVSYNPPFASYTPSTRVSSATAGHDVTLTIKPASGHKLKVTGISFDCVKIGTDGGNVDAVAKWNGGQKSLQPVDLLRNKITATNTTGYSHNEYSIGDMLVDEQGLTLVFYLYNINGTDNENPKSIGLRNITVEGVADEEIFDVSHYLSGFSCMAKTGSTDAVSTSLYDIVKNLKNGESARFGQKLYAQPTDFTATVQPALADRVTAQVTYNAEDNTAEVTIQEDGKQVFTFSLRFTVSNRPPKGQPVALKRGLMALHLSNGNLVSWRSRKSDTRNYKFKLYRGTATAQASVLNSGNFIMGKTNFLDTSGTAANYYRLEVYDDQGNIVETDVSTKTWDNQTKYITLQGGAPTDPTSAKATYTPNDASYCDMDGDGEYEIILKWAPSNEKDAASSGTTSPAFYSCYKLDGTRLWMLHTGHNMFNSAHTTPFVAWDLDGDGFGEFMVKTAPGAVDGEGNYILLGDDDPKANLKSGRGKQDHGSEYITVFDGMTGSELQTIPYHTAYGDVTTSFWGDSQQNRSERYLAGIAWLSGEDENPSAIFARGYYSGCRIGAYDWDGANLTLRWLHSGTGANSGTVTYADGTVKNLSKSVYGEGAHSFAVGDVTGDGKQEITYGSGALNADGTTLYRTGLGHGDATHLGDFIPSRPGQEFFMAHEKGKFGIDLRDARTGEILVRREAGSDTGRGLMAHFNPEAEDAYFMNSADSYKDDSNKFHYYVYDSKGNQLTTVDFGSSGAGINNRIFWNGNLADDYYDKSYLAVFNPSTMSFERQQVNGTWYTAGTLNNDSKNNPCVLGDLLGDWREEIVNWSQSGNDFQLVINATNYETPYIFPHLMDDYAYRAQVIAENSVYNQPPHVSYDPRTEKTITPRTFTADPGTAASHLSGRYWGSLFTTYPVIIPENTMAWNVSAVTTDGTDTLKVSRLAAGKIIPANRAVIFNSATATPKFVPTSLAATASVSTMYLKGFYCDSLVTDASDYKFTYAFRNGDRGVGFYRTHGTAVIPGGEAFAQFGMASAVGADSYVLGQFYNAAIVTGIADMQPAARPADDAIYSLQGIRLEREPAHGVFIRGSRLIRK